MTVHDNEFYRQHTFNLPKNSKLTEEIVQQLDNMLEFATADEYRNTLIEIYHMYICKEHDALPINFRDMADQMYLLIDFWKRVGEEKEG